MLGRIAIHLSSDKSCERRIDVGLRLAREHGAEVIGIYPTDDLVGHFYDESFIPHDAREALHLRQQDQRTASCERFMEKAKAAGVKAQWRLPRGDAEEALCLHARYCDLIIMSKADAIDNPSGIIPNRAETVIMASGRPVLMVPAIGTMDTLGQRILYCWDQKREAARAFSDATPLLKKCKELVVLEIDRDDAGLAERDIRENDFVDYCTTLGYPKPTRLVRSSTDIGVGNVILNTATDTGSDLIVMGTYGHSRMRQWVMGGASRTLLSTMTVPLLMSH
ncbi:MAG: universal stress protein [Castellaniella sp.]